jgi:apolipoprotein N-acyltransferase
MVVRLLLVALRSIAAGLCIAVALPPGGWALPGGWWPLAFVGVALWDRLLADQSWGRRLRRSWLVAMVWLGLSMVWLVDFTPPGYAVAVILFGGYFAVAAAAVPPGRARWVALPGSIALATWFMGIFPFGGVPLAQISMTQATTCAAPCTAIDSPVLLAARLVGPLLVVALVVVGGIVLSALVERAWRPALIGAAVIVVASTLGAIAPHGHDIGELRIAIVQGGGPQHTPPGNADAVQVFQRHLAATNQLVPGTVDLVLWPENTVAVSGPFATSPYARQLEDSARRLRTTLVVGVTEDSPLAPTFLNASIVINPDGSIGDRYDKVQRVPFGEYVPFRDLIEKLAGGTYIPPRDAIEGTGTGGLPTQVGQLGVVISWEDFFSERARDAILDGHGQLLANPTNGSSYWLTQVQGQQVAASRLRAVETGRWTVQAAPTGYSVVVAPNGALVEQTEIEQTFVIQTALPLREGNTPAALVGPWVMVVVSLALVASGWVLQRRRDAELAGSGSAVESDLDHERDGSVVDELDLHVGPEPPGLDERAPGP